MRPLLLEDTLYTVDVLTSYGTVVEWASAEEAKASMAQGLTMHPVHGLQVVQMHMDLLLFLLACCKEVIPEASSLDSLCSPERPVPVASPTSLASALHVNTFLDMSRNLPYRPPMMLDMSQMRQLDDARTESAQDHIWMLRQDPGYFADIVAGNCEHRLEHLPHDCGRFYEKPTEREILTKAVRDTVTDAYLDFFTWHQLQQRVATLNQMTSSHPTDQLVAAQRLTEPLFEALVQTLFFLENTVLDLVYKIYNLWPASPAARYCYVADCERSCKHRVTVDYAHVRIEDHDIRILHDLFWNLKSARSRRMYWVHTIVDALENYTQKERVSSSISPLVASYMSQLSIASQCIHQLQLFQPWARQVEHTVDMRKGGLFIKHAQLFAKWHDTLLTDFKGTMLPHYGKPGEKFDYPFDQSVTESNTNKMGDAEGVLDKFWALAEEHYRENTGTTPQELMNVRSFALRPEVNA